MMGKAKTSRKWRGFTLAELLMVVVILGVLAAIALPRFYPQAEKSRASEAIGILSAIRVGEEAWFLENGAYLTVAVDGDWHDLGLENPNSTAKYWEFDVVGDASNFTATADRNSGDEAGETITLNRAGAWGGTYPYKPN